MSSTPPQPPDAADQLRKLGELRDAGLLTDEEFATKKAQVLARDWGTPPTPATPIEAAPSAVAPAVQPPSVAPVPVAPVVTPPPPAIPQPAPGALWGPGVSQSPVPLSAPATGNWWQRRSRKVKAAIIVVIAILALGVVGTITKKPQTTDAGSTGSVAATVAPSPTEAAVAAQPSPVMSTPEMTEAPTPGVTEAPILEVTEAPTPVITEAPAPTAKVLLKLAGNGIKSSKPFNTSGDSVELGYKFDCSAFGYSGNFQVYVYGAGGSLDIAVNELAMSGSDTTTIYLTGMTGPYHLEMNSECSWAVVVAGMP